MSKEPKKSTIQEIVIGDKKIEIDTTKDYFADLITDKECSDSGITENISDRILEEGPVLSYPEKPIDKIYDFIKLINKFLCALLSHEHLDEDSYYDINILTDIEQSQRQLEEVLNKYWMKNNKEYKGFFNSQLITFAEDIINGLNKITEDTIFDMSIQDIIAEDIYFEEHTKKSVEIMYKNGDEWGAFADTIEEDSKKNRFPDDRHNYFTTTQSVLSSLSARCSYLYTLVENPLAIYESYFEITRINKDKKEEKYNIILNLSDILVEKIEILNKIADNEITRVFGERLSSILHNIGMSNAELGSRLGVSRQAVNEWCKGTKKPTLEKIVKIASILNTTTDYLLRANADRADFEKSHMEQNYGLSENSVDMLKKIKNDNFVKDTLNILISKYKAFENGENCDILSALANYIDYRYSPYIVSEEDMYYLFEHIDTVDNMDEMKSVLKEFKKSVEYSQTDSDIVALQELTTIINRAKEKIRATYKENKNN